MYHHTLNKKTRREDPPRKALHPVINSYPDIPIKLRFLKLLQHGNSPTKA